jgi:hypothetical protein
MLTRMGSIPDVITLFSSFFGDKNYFYSKKTLIEVLMHEKGFIKKNVNFFYLISDFLFNLLCSYRLRGVPPEILT